MPRCRLRLNRAACASTCSRRSTATGAIRSFSMRSIATAPLSTVISKAATTSASIAPPATWSVARRGATMPLQRTPSRTGSMNAPADPLSLYGTPEPLPERRLLRAGPLSAVLENGNLRDIRFAGIEIVRAVNYLARDEAWGTMAATLADLAVAETPTAFDVRYSGCCEGPGGRFRYAMHIRGEASGRLLLEADGEALSDFHTNRTGFVV